MHIYVFNYIYTYLKVLSISFIAIIFTTFIFQKFSRAINGVKVLLSNDRGSPQLACNPPHLFLSLFFDVTVRSIRREMEREVESCE